MKKVVQNPFPPPQTRTDKRRLDCIMMAKYFHSIFIYYLHFNYFCNVTLIFKLKITSMFTYYQQLCFFKPIIKCFCIFYIKNKIIYHYENGLLFPNTVWVATNTWHFRWVDWGSLKCHMNLSASSKFDFNAFGSKKWLKKQYLDLREISFITYFKFQNS